MRKISFAALATGVSTVVLYLMVLLAWRLKSMALIPVVMTSLGVFCVAIVVMFVVMKKQSGSSTDNSEQLIAKNRVKDFIALAVVVIAEVAVLTCILSMFPAPLYLTLTTGWKLSVPFIVMAVLISVLLYNVRGIRKAR